MIASFISIQQNLVVSFVSERSKNISRKYVTKMNKNGQIDTYVNGRGKYVDFQISGLIFFG